MPTYQYECSGCGHSFDVMQSIIDPKMKKCPECGELKLHRLIGSGSGIIFKGSGFYETDYKKSAGKAKEEKTCPASGQKTSCPCPCDKSA